MTNPPRRRGDATPQAGRGAASRRRPAPFPWAALVVDLLLVTLFALLGRLSHAEGLTLLGLVATATPFLSGTVAGWAFLAWRRDMAPASLTGGVVVWLSTVILGMLIRVLAGTGTAVSFILVATAVIGLFLVGWRYGGAMLVRRTGGGAHERR